MARRENSPPPPIKRFGEYLVREVLPLGEELLQYIRRKNEGPGGLLKPKLITVETGNLFSNLPKKKLSTFNNTMSHIGRGQFANVYSCQLPEYGKVAFKAFRRGSPVTKELDLAVLRHPTIVQSLAVVYDGENVVGFLMEYFPKSLKNVIENDQFKFSKSQALDWILQVATALLFLHESGIMHRDVKPDNILVEMDERNQPIRVKLGDLGVAGTIYQSRHTAGAGTPIYQAPEINIGFEDRLPYDQKVDVYSLGITLWQLVYRKPIIEYTQFDLPEHSEINPFFANDCPTEIKELINECTLDPIKRIRMDMLINKLEKLKKEFRIKEEKMKTDVKPPTVC